jgi:hypothetical protein
MGQVYRARDTKLHRDVADPKRRLRDIGEARVALQAQALSTSHTAPILATASGSAAAGHQRTISLALWTVMAIAILIVGV